jgi:hypothetical protein
MKMFYLCIVKLRDGRCAAGRKNYRSGQAGKFPWAGRKNEVREATRKIEKFKN